MSRIFKGIDPFFYKRYQKIVCITETVGDVVKKHTGLSDSNIEVIIMECQSTRLKIVFLEIDLIFFRMQI
jgi:hypothetical protein